VAERFAEALETSGVDVVPKVSITGAGGEGGANGGVMQALLTLLMSEKLGLAVDATDQRVVEAVED